MNRKMLLLSLATGLALVACSPEAAEPVAESAPAPAEAAVAPTQEVDVDQLKQRLDAGENIYLLDVRTPAELAEHGLIKGAVNIPIRAGEPAGGSAEGPSGSHLLHAGRARRARR